VVAHLSDAENRSIGENVGGNGDGLIDRQTRFAYHGNQIVMQFNKDFSYQRGSSNVFRFNDT
jgi:hypothetical protein